MRWRAWTMAGVIATAGMGLLGGGCDDPNDVPPDVLKARQQAAEQLPKVKPPPTTQELLTGPKTRTPLGAFPVSLEVPRDWKMQSIGDGALITMTGPASSGEINIQLINQGTGTATSVVETTMAQAKKEMASKPHPVNRLELRTLGPAKLVEQRMLSGEFVNGKPPTEVWGDVVIESMKAGSQTTTRAVINPLLVKWSSTLFIPAADGKFAVRTLAFMGLRLAEYEQDKAFLEQVMKSLQFEE